MTGTTRPPKGHGCNDLINTGMAALSQFGNLLDVERIGRVPARQGMISAPSRPYQKILRFHFQTEATPDMR
jgi:hypothetical protein